MVFVGDTLYLSFPQVPAPQAGKPWVSESMGSGGPILPAIRTRWPCSACSVRGATTSLTLGASTVDGTAVHVYRVTVTPAALRAEMSRADIPAGLARTAEQALGTSSTVGDRFRGRRQRVAPSSGCRLPPCRREPHRDRVVHRGLQRLRCAGLHHRSAGEPGRAPRAAHRQAGAEQARSGVHLASLSAAPPILGTSAWPAAAPRSPFGSGGTHHLVIAPGAPTAGGNASARTTAPVGERRS